MRDRFDHKEIICYALLIGLGVLALFAIVSKTIENILK